MNKKQLDYTILYLYMLMNEIQVRWVSDALQCIWCCKCSMTSLLAFFRLVAYPKFFKYYKIWTQTEVWHFHLPHVSFSMVNYKSNFLKSYHWQLCSIASLICSRVDLLAFTCHRSIFSSFVKS